MGCGGVKYISGTLPPGLGGNYKGEICDLLILKCRQMADAGRVFER